MRLVRASSAQVHSSEVRTPHRPSFPSLVRFRPVAYERTSAPYSLPSHRYATTSTSSPPVPSPPPSSTTSAPPPLLSPASSAPSATRWRPSPTSEEILARFGPPPPTSGQVARATKTQVSVRSTEGAVLWELPWSAVHSVFLVVDAPARSKYWALFEKGSMEARKISLTLPEAAAFTAQLRRRPGWLRENENRAISTATEEASKHKGGQLSFLCWTDLKSHFARKYGPPSPIQPSTKRAQKLLSRLAPRSAGASPPPPPPPPSSSPPPATAATSASMGSAPAPPSSSSN